MSTTKVYARSEGPTKTVVQARDFQMVIDEPPNFGGRDEAPTPIEYMFASLSGCLSVMAHFVAREMGIQLNGLQIAIEGDLNPARLMGQSRDVRAGVSGIRVRMTPDTDADPDTLKKWLETVEDRCPVTDNLVHPTPVQFVIG